MDSLLRAVLVAQDMLPLRERHRHVPAPRSLLRLSEATLRVAEEAALDRRQTTVEREGLAGLDAMVAARLEPVPLL